MIGLIFSLDYEIYGDGEGEFQKLMIDPTEKLLSIFNRYGAKLTIMVEVAEIIAAKRYKEFETVCNHIEMQLKHALSQKHDIQLHIHPQWFNANYVSGCWNLDFDEYSMAHLSKGKSLEYINIGKKYLENLGKEVDNNYDCIAFRAGNWLMQPSLNIVQALEMCGLKYDTSVFKWGKIRNDKFSLDYTEAASNLFPWRIDPTDINKSSKRTGLYEIPILTTKSFILTMLTSKRLAIQKKSNQHAIVSQKRAFNHPISFVDLLKSAARDFRLWYPKKFDFCRMTFKEMKSCIDYAVETCMHLQEVVPVVAIGHSKDFSDDGVIERFLDYVNSRKEIQYTTFTRLKSGI